MLLVVSCEIPQFGWIFLFCFLIFSSVLEVLWPVMVFFFSDLPGFPFLVHGVCHFSILDILSYSSFVTMDVYLCVMECKYVSCFNFLGGSLFGLWFYGSGKSIRTP